MRPKAAPRHRALTVGFTPPVKRFESTLVLRYWLAATLASDSIIAQSWDVEANGREDVKGDIWCAGVADANRSYVADLIEENVLLERPYAALRRSTGCECWE